MRKGKGPKKRKGESGRKRGRHEKAPCSRQWAVQDSGHCLSASTHVPTPAPRSHSHQKLAPSPPCARICPATPSDTRPSETSFRKVLWSARSFPGSVSGSGCMTARKETCPRPHRYRSWFHNGNDGWCVRRTTWGGSRDRRMTHRTQSRQKWLLVSARWHRLRCRQPVLRVYCARAELLGSDGTPGT